MDERLKPFIRELEIEVDALAPSWVGAAPEVVLAAIKEEIEVVELALDLGEPLNGEEVHVAALALLLSEAEQSEEADWTYELELEETLDEVTARVQQFDNESEIERAVIESNRQRGLESPECDERH